MTIKPTGRFDFGAIKIADLGNAPMTLKELQENTMMGLKSLSRMVSQTPRGTQGKVIKHFLCVDGRVLHPTKGFAKTEGGGYAKRSRRSNRT